MTSKMEIGLRMTDRLVDGIGGCYSMVVPLMEERFLTLIIVHVS
jgi:hypothetical protein